MFANVDRLKEKFEMDYVFLSDITLEEIFVDLVRKEQKLRAINRLTVPKGIDVPSRRGSVSFKRGAKARKAVDPIDTAASTAAVTAPV